jgi:hypothetical protein
MQGPTFPRIEGEEFRKRVDLETTSVPILISLSFLRKQESRRESGRRSRWIPAFAGMTERRGCGNRVSVMIELDEMLLKGGSYEGTGSSGSLFRLRLTLVLLQYRAY